jgi:hypothetical protein
LIACEFLKSLEINRYYSISDCKFLEECLLCKDRLKQQKVENKEDRIVDRVCREINIQEQKAQQEIQDDDYYDESENSYINLNNNLRNRPGGLLNFVLESEFLKKC